MPVCPDESKYFNAFNLFPEIGAIRFKKLLAYFPGLEAAWKAKEGELRRAGLDEKLAQKILSERNKIDPDKEFDNLTKNSISLITIKDKDYPQLLKEIYDPPALLYIKGKLKPDDKFSLSIVGTRKPTHYGIQATLDLTHKLSTAGLTIVSGLALGIDTIAHKTAIEAGGRTIAIIGSGLDTHSIYPTANRKLAEQISDNGAIVSEYPIGTSAMPYHFPARNRIISGISPGTLIIEASEKSGTFLTANHALGQNRQIFAIPGSIYSKNSVGPNRLIKMGAKLVTDINDILEELNLVEAKEYQTARQIIADTKEEELIIKILLEANQPIHIDKITSQSGLDSPVVSATLSLMEIKGKTKNLGGMNYIITNQ